MLIAYDFPPRGASGVFRMAKFARYLPEWGWEPVVVTISDPGPHPDPQLLAELPAGLEILRVPVPALSSAGTATGVAPLAGGSWRSKLKPWIVPDPQIRWVPGAVRQAWKRLQRGDIQAIMTSGPPFSTHLVGPVLKRLGVAVPWLMDLRDVWSEAPNQQILIPYKLNRMVERGCLQSADAVSVVTDGMRRLLIDRLGVEPERIMTITNGFDSCDLDLPEQQPAPTVHSVDRPLKICYAGSIVGLRAKAALGFFAALHRLQTQGINRRQLRVRLIGSFSPEIHQAAADAGDLVDVLPFASHATAIAQMGAADVLLLVQTNDREGRIMHTSKLFEYLALGRPILHIGPPGEVATLLAEVGAGSSVRPTDVDGIVRVVRRLIDCQVAGQASMSAINPVRLQRFERRELAGQLAGLLNQMTGAMANARA